MFSAMSWIGILVCVYALARLLHYAYLRLEDSSQHPFLQKVLIVFCFILWFISAPVALIMGFINMMHYRRLEDRIRADCSEDPSSHNYHKNASIPLEIISVFLLIAVLCCGVQIDRLGDENETLEVQLEEAENKYDIGYEAGLEAAHEEYFDEGYSEGYSAGIRSSENVSYESGYEEGVQDGYSGGHEEGYGEGYTIGYGHALIDYCDKSIRDRVITAMLDFDSYADIYEWLIDQRPVSIDN